MGDREAMEPEELHWDLMLGLLFATVALYVLYHAIFESSKSRATPGKMAIGAIVSLAPTVHLGGKSGVMAAYGYKQTSAGQA
ncbi:MAG: hypothetical protein IH906_04355 [Proteobacteria bacterium]|nr:hypothetical protein [Pseudomonadota bacterium]